MNSPGTSPHDRCADAEEALAPNGYCDLCGHSCDADPAVWDTAGFDICSDCLEGLLDASTYNARSEVGMVGSLGGRS